MLMSRSGKNTQVFVCVFFFVIKMSFTKRAKEFLCAKHGKICAAMKNIFQ